MRPRKPYTLPLPGRPPLLLGERTLVMGILNVTPDSFADGGQFSDPARAIEHGLRMIEQGADVVDVGGESTRPGARPVSEDEELRRVVPVIEGLARDPAVLVSVDTYKAAVAREAVAHGAAIVNDISALQYDGGLADAVAETGAALVLMHNRGRSRDMYGLANYDDVAGEIIEELDGAIGRAVAAGIRREAIVVDPGLGFAKRADQSFAALAGLDRLAELDRPVLLGPSRKSFLKLALGELAAEDRDWGTAAAVAAGVIFGAHIVRVHQVGAMAQVVRVIDRVRQAECRLPTGAPDHPM